MKRPVVLSALSVCALLLGWGFFARRLPSAEIGGESRALSTTDQSAAVSAHRRGDDFAAREDSDKILSSRARSESATEREGSPSGGRNATTEGFAGASPPPQRSVGAEGSSSI